MTKEELNEWQKDYESEQLSSGAFILYLKLYISEQEDKLKKEKDLHSLARNRFKEADKHINKLRKEKDYWKLSFNKQVYSARGGYQPVKTFDGKLKKPPKEE